MPSCWQVPPIDVKLTGYCQNITFERAQFGAVPVQLRGDGLLGVQSVMNFTLNLKKSTNSAHRINLALERIFLIEQPFVAAFIL
jgi:hypothetical protein